MLIAVGHAQEQRPGLLYSTYLGGSGNERGEAVSVDHDGNVYMAGVTTSTDFPTTEGAFLRTVDPRLRCNSFNSFCPNAIFVTKISADGQKVLWSTYLHQGFSNGLFGLHVSDLQVNDAGEVYVAGTTDTFRGFPTTPGSFERSCPALSLRSGPVCAFVAKLSRDGSSLLFSSFFGGGILGMEIRRLRLDASGNVILAGYDFFGDAFVAKLDPQFSKLMFVQRLGGTGVAYVGALEVDFSGIYVGGRTHSLDFPATPGALKSHLAGEADGFITKLSAEGNVIFSTLIGGSGFDSVSALWIEPDGSILIGGRTESTDFPTSPSAFQPTYGGGLGDAFISSMTADGSALLFSTFLGGSGDPKQLTEEDVRGIARGEDGSVQVVGTTTALDFPLKNSLRMKAEGQCPWNYCTGIFIASFDGTATRLLASTVLGSAGEDYLNSSVYRAGAWWITGVVVDGFPITADALQATDVAGEFDSSFTGRAYLAQLFVGPQDFRVEVADSQLNIIGGRAVTSIALVGAPAFADEISLSCETPSENYHCRFEPQNVFLGTGRKQVSLTIEQTPELASMPSMLTPIALLLALGTLKTNRRARYSLAFIVLAVYVFTGCRGIAQGSFGSKVTEIRVVAQSATVSHSASLQLSADPR